MSRYDVSGTKNNSIKQTVGFSTAGLVIIFGLLYAIPQYMVWQQGLKGEATLARAKQERQILVEQALAEKESAVLRAEAIAIVGAAAKEYPEYRYQEFLGAFGDALREGEIDQIIYIPTEGMIPITEATRNVQ